MPSFYFPESLDDYKRKTSLTIEGDEFHHIVNVSRHRVGDEILLNNGMGQLAHCEITFISKKNITVSINKIDTYTKSDPEIAVSFSLLKNKNDQLIVEKLTEIGVSQFYPMETRYSVRRINGYKSKESDPSNEKMIKTAITAIKQCDNAFLPKIHSINNIANVIKSVKSHGFEPIIASEIEQNISLEDLYTSIYPKPVCIFIGPEGGFHPDEFELFQQENVRCFSLGNHILRAETAAISSAAVIASYNYKHNKRYY
jgi:16S rRNA (uracil1498-N3)-methyltransferase